MWPVPGGRSAAPRRASGRRACPAPSRDRSGEVAGACGRFPAAEAPPLGGPLGVALAPHRPVGGQGRWRGPAVGSRPAVGARSRGWPLLDGLWLVSGLPSRRGAWMPPRGLGGGPRPAAKVRGMGGLSCEGWWLVPGLPLGRGVWVALPAWGVVAGLRCAVRSGVWVPPVRGLWPGLGLPPGPRGPGAPHRSLWASHLGGVGSARATWGCPGPAECCATVGFDGVEAVVVPGVPPWRHQVGWSRSGVAVRGVGARWPGHAIPVWARGACCCGGAGAREWAVGDTCDARIGQGATRRARLWRG
ncbi:hypothetical protein HNP84_001429 [Thermocatellispora tengchongensis]|uniref:Uncharacterized protein n=1 Tax=Thermocatellispora tengchongensis TaxID=1073253 RepID=A0A840NZT4_9ACTN|nr:hypothetical protein [Thermocatellispora tengchongensis]